MKETNLKLIKALRHQLHKHPEVSNQESWTKAHLMAFIKEHTSLEIIDQGKWFYAAYRVNEAASNIAFRADFDAVKMDEGICLDYASVNPGVAHKCGHDGHAAVLCGLALELETLQPKQNIFLLFQHAEETGDGALECQEMIKKEKIDEIYAFHNMSDVKLNAVKVIEGVSHYASKGMELHFEGKQSHASQPELGVNPSYAIAKIITFLEEYVHSIDPELLCTIVHVNVGERAFGISPSQGNLLLTIRAKSEKALRDLQITIEQIATDFAVKDLLRTRFKSFDEFPETRNTKLACDKVRSACDKLGIEVVDGKVYRASEDFGYYTKLTDGAIFYIGNGLDYPAIHTTEYDFNDDIIETGVKLFKALIQTSEEES